MATVTAEEPVVATDRSRRLWQVPIFLLGLAAFLSVWMGWVPLPTPDPAPKFGKDLEALRAKYEELSPDPAELNRLLTQVTAYPDQTPHSQLVLGSGYSRLAELTGAVDQSHSWWVLANQHFEKVRADQLTDPADAARFTFRAAKARIAVGLPADLPAAEVDRLRNLLIAIPVGEPSGETFRLLADLSLRSAAAGSQPLPIELDQAKEALGSYLKEAGLATPPASLARAKLRLSELYLATNEPAAARKWLEKIGTDAPADVLIPAKAQLARILTTAGEFDDAARNWEQVRSGAAVAPGLRTEANYNLGLCALTGRNADPVKAARFFTDAARGEPGMVKLRPESAAAAVRLASLDLQSPDRATHKEAVGLLAGAVKGEGLGGLMPVNEVQAVFETAVATLTADRDFENAVRVTDAYKAVAVAGKDQEKRAEVLTAWAIDLHGSPEAAEKFAAAANEYLAVAGTQTVVSSRADLLRRGAGLYLRAGNLTAALDTYETLVKLRDLPAEIAGPAWSDYADALISAKLPTKALMAFNQAMKSPGPGSTTARWTLARKLVESRHPGLVPLGTELFQQIVNMENVNPDDQRLHERGCVELAQELVRVGKFKEAETVLRKQLNFYRTGPEAALGKVLLGISLLQQSIIPPGGQEMPKAPQWREEALKLFKQVTDEVEAREKALPKGSKLSDRDGWLKIQAGLRILQTYQQMGKPYELMAAAAPMLKEYKGTVDELIILSLIYQANRMSNRPELVNQTRAKMLEVFEKLKAQPNAFKGTTGEYSREYWEKVWFAPDGG